MTKAAIGHRTWIIPGGRIPLRSTGREPDFTSCDEICLLNTGRRDAEVTATIYYARSEPVDSYGLHVPAQRVLQVRVNDLIDPQAIPLDEPYAMVIESSSPIVVQFTRRDTSQAENAIATTLAFPWPG